MTFHSQSYNMPVIKSLYPRWSGYIGGDMLPVREPGVEIVQEILTMRFDLVSDPLTISFPKGFSVVKTVDWRSDQDNNDGCTQMIEFIICRSCFARRAKEGDPFFNCTECNCVGCVDPKNPMKHGDYWSEYEGSLLYSTADWSPESIDRFIADHKDCDSP